MLTVVLRRLTLSRTVAQAVTSCADAVVTVWDTLLHQHRCDRCGHTWAHEAACRYNAGAHMCPVCGTGPYWDRWLPFAN